MNDRTLTRAELQLMQILWDKGEAFVNDILDALPEPKPAYSTVSTIVRILVSKGFVSYRSYGKSHRYYPLISRQEYTSQFMMGVRDVLFGGSNVSMLSFFAQRERLSGRERRELIGMLEDME
ncbi:MAG: BlaI/MecI/CopY family transcriptional regulator [Rikenellaceae bacterium]|nr:BlaI/MecI/CopY family transcriptional regulator [Rikenellaceae bacterium]